MPDNYNTGSNNRNGNRNRTNGNRSYGDRQYSRNEAGRSSVRSESGRRTSSNTVRSQQGRPQQGRSAQQGYQQNSGYSSQRSSQYSQRSARPQNSNYSNQSAVQNTKRTNGKRRKQGNKKTKVIIYAIEFIVLAILVGVLWFILKGTKVDYVSIDEDAIVIDNQVQEIAETGAMKGYRNVALFGVDSRQKELDKNTRTDTIIIASINEDTKEVKLVSVFRDTYLNMSNDTYNKANAAYAKGGPQQAINMLNMNLDLNITDFVTIGFDGLIDVIDAIGGIEIDVKEAEIDHLNNYQISMVGKESGKNAKGEANYTAEAGKDYTPVTSAGVQTLNGLQATAYCRIRYVGNDFERAQRQRTVLTKVAEKAQKMDISKLNKIADAVFGETATSLSLDEIVSLLSGVAEYKIGENEGFPFEDTRATGTIGKTGSCVVPVDLQTNVVELHKFLFNESDYTPSDTVKQCSEKIYNDTSKYVN